MRSSSRPAINSSKKLRRVSTPTRDKPWPFRRSTASPLQQQLVIQANKWIDLRLQKLANHLTESQQKRYTELQSKLSEFDTQKPLPLPTALAVVDIGSHAPPTYRLSTGNFRKPQEEVQRRLPGVSRR